MSSSSDRGVIHLTRVPTPLGQLITGSLGDELCLCTWAASCRNDRHLNKLQTFFKKDIKEAPSGVLQEAERQLLEYFAGTRTAFDIPLTYAGTPFQIRVWEELRAVHYCETASYKEIAARVGRPGAVRAVATACAVNPVSIIVPCHRVIGSDGSLTGYAGGIDVKRRLLLLEGVSLPG